MTLTPKTHVHDLLETYPFLLDYLSQYHPKFDLLKNRAVRATVGRMATLKMVAAMGELELGRLLSDLQAAIQTQSGERVEIELSAGEDEQNERLETLKAIMQELHAGSDPAAVKQRFHELLSAIAPGEISQLEEQLIRDGLPVQEVQRLCDLHVDLFKGALEKAVEINLPAGHPVHTYLAENQALQEHINRFDELLRQLGKPYSPEKFRQHQQALEDQLEQLALVQKHYQRKENELFPIMEKHGITAPPKVMWGVDDEIRALFKAVRQALENRQTAEFEARAPALLHHLVEMIYKENKILFPMCLETFAEEEWVQIRKGEDELGYIFVTPGDAWRPEPAAGGEKSAPGSRRAPGGRLALNTGELTVAQVDLLLTHLPMDVTFVDASDEVRYYSEGRDRLFPRSPGVIGRKVQNCHPPQSVHVVNRILEEFRAGHRDLAEFWIQMHGRLIHIRYFAVRDRERRYQGCLEVTQDITGLKNLEGERRLLDWDRDEPAGQ